MTVIELDQNNFEEIVENGKTPVIVDFWAGWCMPCKMMAPIFKELSEDYKGKLKFAKLNTDQNKNISDNFSIRGIPCLILFHKAEEVERIVGFAPKEVLKQKIDSALSKV
ncbi:thioredoxin [Candidatus Woesearchaeota archaeon]|nr:thioredoxin [Candidatus Woesearchaeota archaeon]